MRLKRHSADNAKRLTPVVHFECRVTAWHRGGGHKRLYRHIDFRGGRFGAEGTVQRIEYDPNRSARIALVKYGEGGARFLQRLEVLKTPEAAPCSRNPYGGRTFDAPFCFYSDRDGVQQG